MKSDIAGILAAAPSAPRIMVLGDADRDWHLAWLLADRLDDQVDLGVSHGGVAAGLVDRRRPTQGGGTLKVRISPRRGFWEADHFGAYDMLLLGGLEQYLDPLDILIYARSLDVRLLCIETGVVPSSLGAAKGILDEAVNRVARRKLAPTIRRVLATQLDVALRARAVSGPAAHWEWYMTATGVADLLLRAGWHAFRQFESFDSYGSFFICGRDSGANGDPFSSIGKERRA